MAEPKDKVGGVSGVLSGSVARTHATGGGAMDPELLAWSSSLEPDRSLVREDILGSAAHVTMLHRTGLVEADDAKKLRAELLAMYDAAASGELVLADGEEDVHMAIESMLTQKLGDVGKRLHTARSRNDQVALALRLHVRDQCAHALGELASLISEIAHRAEEERDVVLPAYTHRQRAQPVSAAFVMCAWALGLLRAADALVATSKRVSESPLGCGACSGTSLPIDRDVVAELLGFDTVSINALDTIGNRDFVLDWTWGAARALLALSRLSTDVIDFTTSEFGFLKIGDVIAAGSSMMPQKKNPDIFELVRAKTASGVGNVMSMLMLVKGLPSGYNRDFQDDRQAVLETGPLLRGAVRAVHLALPHLTFDRARCLAAVSDGSTQATDVAEALVRKGVPFREAYKATGALVAIAHQEGFPLAKMTVDRAKTVHAKFDAAVLAVLDPVKAMEAKKSAGGTAPERVSEQLAWISSEVFSLSERVSQVPKLDDLRDQIASATI